MITETLTVDFLLNHTLISLKDTQFIKRSCKTELKQYPAKDLLLMLPADIITSQHFDHLC